MAKDYTKMLLVSANVGSIFEDPEKMLKLWLQEFLLTIKRLEPGFVAIHCQEVGGKNYEDSMKHVNSFVKELFSAEEMQDYDRSRFFLDEDFTAVEQFTALGNIYFIHKTVQNVQIFDFQECQFVPLQGREVLSGNIFSIPIKEKAKFPQEFFPDFKWSRKGFIRTRWNIQNSIFDLVNIHLFHDASNIVAMESSPSQYSNNRERTLRHTLNRFETDQYEKVPIFLFGDFNFRLDSHKLIQKLTEDSTPHHTRGKKNDVSKIVFTDKTTQDVILTIEKKGFEHHQHKQVFLNNNGHCQLQEFDKEALPFRDKLLEHDITFPPSYPFSEDTDDGTSYMKTRCPSWCDRVLYTPSAKHLFHDECIDYDMMGTLICMGDHKPIYLSWKLRHNTGNGVIDVSITECEEEPFAHRQVRKVISINGEEVSANDLNDINIHDYASFERQEHMTREFMSSIKRKQGGTRFSFKNVVKDVIRKERIMRALKHYSHRSDSETEDTDEEHNRHSKEHSLDMKQSPVESPNSVFEDGNPSPKLPATDINKNEAAGDKGINQVIGHVTGSSSNHNTVDVKATLTTVNNNDVVTAHSIGSTHLDDVTISLAKPSDKPTNHNPQDKMSTNHSRDDKTVDVSNGDEQVGRKKKKENDCCVVL